MGDDRGGHDPALERETDGPAGQHAIVRDQHVRARLASARDQAAGQRCPGRDSRLDRSGQAGGSGAERISEEPDQSRWRCEPEAAADQLSAPDVGRAVQIVEGEGVGSDARAAETEGGDGGPAVVLAPVREHAAGGDPEDGPGPGRLADDPDRLGKGRRVMEGSHHHGDRGRLAQIGRQTFGQPPGRGPGVRMPIRGGGSDGLGQGGRHGPDARRMAGRPKGETRAIIRGGPRNVPNRAVGGLHPRRERG